MRSRWMLCLPFVLLVTNLDAQVIAVPPAVHRASPVAKSEPVSSLLTSTNAPAMRIALAAPTAAEKARRGSARPGTAATSSAPGPLPVKRRVLAIGFARAIPDGERPLSMSALPWQPLADGGIAARIDVSSPGAAAIRIGMTMSKATTGVALRFVGSAAPQQVFGPFTAKEITASGVYWSPVLEGDAATVEIYL